MSKKEKYTEEAWQRCLEKARIKYQEKKEYHKEKNKQWRLEHPNYKKEYNNNHGKENIEYSKKSYNNSRKIGKTYFCTENYELIENYELAKADNFDPKKWHLHHRLENYWSHATLKRKGLYYNVNPEALIWLPADEHHSDKSLSVHHPELSKWHQRRLERE